MARHRETGPQRPVCGSRWALKPSLTRGRTSRARRAAAPRSAPAGPSVPLPQPANRYRGLGWALRACDGARADELSKDYRALRT